MSRAVYKYLWRVVLALFQKPYSTTPLGRRQVQAFYSIPATFQPISVPVFFPTTLKRDDLGQHQGFAGTPGTPDAGREVSCPPFFGLSVMLSWPWLWAMSTFTPSCVPAAVYFSLLALELSSELSEGQHYEVILEIMGMFFRSPWALNAWWLVGSNIESCQERSISQCGSVVDKCIDF